MRDNNTENPDALQRRLTQLKKRHQGLDDEIKQVQSKHGTDDIRIYRLKKDKLGLKDEIRQLEMRLRPDIIA